MKITVKDGKVTEAKNVNLLNNMIKPIEPKRNAVIIDFAEDGDVTKRLITIECKNEELYQRMLDYARKLPTISND